MCNQYIKHYGILGMKWGRRKKYSADYVNARRKKDVRQMSNEELRQANNRLEMERKYKTFTAKKSVGKRAISALGSATAAVTTVATAVGMYKKYAEPRVNSILSKVGDYVVNEINIV